MPSVLYYFLLNILFHLLVGHIMYVKRAANGFTFKGIGKVSDNVQVIIWNYPMV